MEQLFPIMPCVHMQHQQGENVRRPVMMTIIASGARVVYRIYCELDSDGISINRDEPDPDDLTDYGYRYRNQNKPRKTWLPPGYGDDD